MSVVPIKVDLSLRMSTVTANVDSHYKCRLGGKHVNRVKRFENALRSTAIEQQKYKNETQKIVDFRGDYVCIFFSFLCAPLWTGRINEKNIQNETEAHGILVI